MTGKWRHLVPYLYSKLMAVQCALFPRMYYISRLNLAATRPPVTPVMQSLPIKKKVTLIEINSNCNLNCRTCQTSLSSRKKEVMSPEMLDTILVKLGSDKPKLMAIHSIGEPLLYPRLEDIFAVLRKHKVRVELTSNGLLLDRRFEVLKENADLIHFLMFSIDGANKTTYEKIRVNGEFEKLVANLELLKEKGTGIFKRVMICCVVSADNVGEIAEMASFFMRYVDHRNVIYVLADGLSAQKDDFASYNPLPDQIVQSSPCAMLLGEQCFILSNGDVSLCCRDYFSDLVIGNILRDGSLAEICNGARALAVMEGSASNPSCRTCYSVQKPYAELVDLYIHALYDIQKGREREFYQRRIDAWFSLIRKGLPDRAAISDALA